MSERSGSERQEAVEVRVRAVLCVHCGVAIPYQTDTLPEVVAQIREAMKAHDRICPDNPLVIENAELRAALTAERAARAQKSSPDAAGGVSQGEGGTSPLTPLSPSAVASQRLPSERGWRDKSFVKVDHPAGTASAQEDR